MKNFFDYLFFKLAKAYFKWDKTRAITAVCCISLMQFFIIAILICVPLRLIYPMSSFVPYKDIVKYVAIGGAFLIMFLNERRYKNKYSQLEEQFKEESSPRLKTIFAFTLVFLPLVIFLIFMDNLIPL